MRRDIIDDEVIICQVVNTASISWSDQCPWAHGFCKIRFGKNIACKHVAPSHLLSIIAREAGRVGVDFRDDQNPLVFWTYHRLESPGCVIGSPFHRHVSGIGVHFDTSQAIYKCVC